MPESRPHQALIEEIDRLQDLAGEWSRLFPQAATQAQHWQKVLSQVQAHVAEDTCRLAVVGAVKSGKSTLINALVGQDLLRRGAGILTAMITRVQPGQEPRAILQFKDWAEIHGEIHRALGLLPSSRLRERTAPLDLRQEADREILAQVLAEAQQEELWREGSLEQNYLLLRSYLAGYGLVADFLAAGGQLALNGPDLSRHRELVTQEATAVYLKDVLLHVPFPWRAPGVELGDCQGSDSPIPQHLAQVLAYLLKGDLVLYAVSSRVGLRQADFQFLAELKRMGLLPHILFHLNLDLAEHRSLAEVEGLRTRVLQELTPWQPDPPLYAFSALKLLLDRRRARGEALDHREEALLSLWAVDPEITAFSDGETTRFQQDLEAALERLQRHRLAGGSLSQVQMVARGLKEQLELTHGLLAQDLGALQELETRLRARQQPLKDTLASLRRTLEGATPQLQKTLKARVNSLLDLQGGEVGGALARFIRGYEPSWEKLLPPETLPPLRTALYQLFQEFQQALGHFVTAEINVSLVEFVRGQETWLQQELTQAVAPLFLALQEALTLYYRETAALGLAAQPPLLAPVPHPRPAGLELPLLQLELNPGWWGLGEAWLRLGAGFLRRGWEALKRRLGRGTPVDPRSQLLAQLTRTLKALKGWLVEQVRVQLLDYQERLKFQYFFPLLDCWLKDQEASLENNLGSLLSGLEGVAGAMQLAEEERLARRRRLAELIPQVQRCEQHLADLER